jgi:nitrogen fixation protein FixH
MTRELTGRHVLYILLGFFGIAFAANGIMIYLAVSTSSGREANAYSQGLHYNERIAAARAQAALHWSHTVELDEAGGVRIVLTDKAGAPVSGLNLQGEIGRPAADQFTHRLVFTETRPGLYAASPGALEAGSWIVTVAALRGHAPGEQPVYRIKERQWLKPKP